MYLKMLPLNRLVSTVFRFVSIKNEVKFPYRQFLSTFRELDEESKESLPRITCPKKLLQKLEHKKKLFNKRYPSCKGPLVISCARKSYNFHQGERFDKFDVHRLVSCGWKNKKRVGDEFTLVSHSVNPSLLKENEMCSFQSLGINEKLCTGLEQMGFHTPTSVQKHAIPPLLKGNSVICAAETGSGKTLAYLLPTVEKLLQEKQLLNSFSLPNCASSLPNTPNTIIITPNRELSNQIMEVAKSLLPYADFLPHCIAGGENTFSSLKDTSCPMDVLVTTPGMLQKLLKTKHIHGNNIQRLIMDESDTLLDDSFISDIQHILRLLQFSPAEMIEPNAPSLVGVQIVLVSATMPQNVQNALGNILPTDSLVRVTTQGLHHLQPHVAQKFIRINPNRKPEKLIELLKQSTEKNETTLVFAKNNKTCYYLEKMLNSIGIDCLRMSGELAPRDRNGVFRKFKEGYSNILMATDIASRGLDTTNVCHVINYDFPSFISDYIHRVGRVGRIGVQNAGHVTSFVSYRYDVDLVWKIETAARKRAKLDNVNANIKKLLNNYRQQLDHIEVLE